MHAVPVLYAAESGKPLSYSVPDCRCLLLILPSGTGTTSLPLLLTKKTEMPVDGRRKRERERIRRRCLQVGSVVGDVCVTKGVTREGAMDRVLWRSKTRATDSSADFTFSSLRKVLSHVI